MYLLIDLVKITQSLREGLAGTAFRRTNCEAGPKTALSMTVNILVSENTVQCYRFNLCLSKCDCTEIKISRFQMPLPPFTSLHLIYWIFYLLALI
jgi:hypothetical protein